MERAFADASGAVLKVTFNGEISRIPLAAKPDLKTVLEKIIAVWGGNNLPLMKYLDEEGDMCTLVEATFADFLLTARPPFDSKEAGRPVLKVTLLEAEGDVFQETSSKESLPSEESKMDSPTHNHQLQQHEPAGEETEVLELSADILAERTDEQEPDHELDTTAETDVTDDSEYELVSFDEVNETSMDAQTPSAVSESAVVKRRKVSDMEAKQEEDGSEVAMGESKDLDEEEALAIVEKAKKACEDELANHLRDWLASSPADIRYEAWIDAVHPENASQSGSKTVDSRMYLEASLHRQLWNETAVASADLDPQEREHRFVTSTESLQAAQNAVSDDQPEQPWDTTAVLNPSAPASLLQQAASEISTAPSQEAEEATGPSQREASPSAPSLQEAVLYLTSFLDRRRLGAEQCAEQPEAKATSTGQAGPAVVWKEEAVHFLAASFCGAARQLKRHAPRTLGLGLPEDYRPGLRLLAEVLRESGPEYETLASAAMALASGSTLNGDGVAELLGRASCQKWEVRLVYARALLACCPEVLVPVLPAHLREMEPRAAEEARRAARGAIQSAREQAALMRQQTVAAAREAAAARVAEARSRAAETRAKALRHAAQAHRTALIAACRR